MICHPYEDRELVLEMMKQEALQEIEDMEANANPFVPAGFEGLIAGLALKAQAAKPQPKKRVTLLAPAIAQLEQGLLPEPVEITSEANLTYNVHMAKLYEFAKAGFRNAVEDYPIGGMNTYARALKGYRDLLIKYLDTKEGAAKSKMAAATPATRAKKISAAPAKMSASADAAKATSAAKAAKPVTSKAASAKARKAPVKKK